MPRYTPVHGKKIISKPQRFPVPPRLLGALDAQAAKVLQLRDDCDRLEDRVRKLDHDAYAARLEADKAADPGMRKRLYELGDLKADQAATARIALDRAERSFRQEESALAALHAEAQSWQRGEHEEEG